MTTSSIINRGYLAKILEDKAFTAATVAGFAVVLALFVFSTGSPLDTDFCWPDATRHAMDGVFWLDFMTHKGWLHPIQYTYSYYMHYPAIAPIMYPPLFPFVESIFFGIGGVTPATAKITSAFFLCCLLIALYVLARHWISHSAALLSMVLFVSVPDVLYWGRQVMLELPALFFIVTGTHFLIDYLETGKQLKMWFAVICALLAFYTKQQALVVLFIYFAGIVTYQGVRKAFAKQHVIAFLIFMAVVTPFLILSWKFTRNFSQAAGVDPVSRIDDLIGSLLYYPLHLPSQVGLLVLVLSVAGFALGLIQFKNSNSKNLIYMTTGWIFSIYIFITSIRHYEVRYAFFWIPPFVLLAGYALDRTFSFLKRPFFDVKYHAAFSIVIVCALIITVVKMDLSQRVPFRSGMKTVAQSVLKYINGPSILLRIQDDGNLIFRIRQLETGKAPFIFRSMKLFESNYYGLKWGIKEKITDEETIKKIIKELGISLIVWQEGFNKNSKVTQVIKKILEEGDSFNFLKTIPVDCHNGIRANLKIYVSKQPTEISTNEVYMFIPSAKFKGQIRLPGI